LVLVICGSFFLMNLITAVVTIRFQDSAEQSRELLSVKKHLAAVKKQELERVSRIIRITTSTRNIIITITIIVTVTINHPVPLLQHCCSTVLTLF
jgi:hypothetical protein